MNSYMLKLKSDLAKCEERLKMFEEMREQLDDCLRQETQLSYVIENMRALDKTAKVYLDKKRDTNMGAINAALGSIPTLLGVPNMGIHFHTPENTRETAILMVNTPHGKQQLAYREGSGVAEGVAFKTSKTTVSCLGYEDVYFLDEMFSSISEENLDAVAEMLAEEAKEAQIVMIEHCPELFSMPHIEYQHTINRDTGKITVERFDRR